MPNFGDQASKLLSEFSTEFLTDDQRLLYASTLAQLATAQQIAALNETLVNYLPGRMA